MSDQPGQPAADDPNAGVNESVARQHEQAAREEAEAEAAAAAEAARKARQDLGLPEEEPAVSVMPMPSPDAELGRDPNAPSQAAFAEEQARNQGPGGGSPPLDDGKSWTSHKDDASLKAKLYRATIAGPEQRGLLTTLDEDEQLANVDVAGPNNQHVAVTFKDSTQIYLSHGYKQASGLKTPLQRERSASMMMDQASREGWEKVWISGSDKQMRDEMWVYAKLNGMKTAGHYPSKAARAKLKRMEGTEFRKGNPFSSLANDIANQVEGAMTRMDDPGDDMPPAAGADDPDPDGPPSGPDGGDPKGDGGGGGEAKDLPEDDGPKADADEFQPPAKVGTAALATTGSGALAAAADGAKAELDEAGKLRDAPMSEADAEAKLDEIGRNFAQAKLDGKYDNLENPTAKAVHDHIFGEQTPETRSAFKDLLQHAGFDVENTDVDKVAERIRSSAQEMIKEANGQTPDADVLSLPVAANDKPSNVVNLVTAAPGMAAHSDAKGTDLASAKDVVAWKPDIGDVAAEAKGAIVVFDPNKNAPAAPAAASPDALIAGAAERLSAKRGAGSEADALRKFEEQTGVDLGSDEPNPKPQLPAIRRA